MDDAFSNFIMSVVEWPMPQISLRQHLNTAIHYKTDESPNDQINRQVQVKPIDDRESDTGKLRSVNISKQYGKIRQEFLNMLVEFQTM